MLYLVGTPVGNLSDISLRALDVLRSVDLVASEDTRKTGLLLKHFDIKKSQISFQEYNEQRVLPRVMQILQAGQSVALVTNAGTPAISDPGFILVRAAIEAGIEITAIPGPAALILAVILSGLAVHSFTYRGFPPRKPGPRRRFLAVDAQSPHTLIFYESPYRLKAFLQDALVVYGNRQAAIANDLTKMFEKVSRGTITDLLSEIETTEVRGEYTVVIAGYQTKDEPASEE